MVNLSITAITPEDGTDDIFNLDIFNKQMELARAETTKAVKADLEKSVGTWKKKPKFIVLSKVSRIENTIQVTTKNKIYLWLDEGTGIYGPEKKPIVIRPVKAKVLRFSSGYTSKTSSRPNAIIAKQGGSFGNPVFAMEVVQKGIRPRNFFNKIQKRNFKKFQTLVTDAILKS